MDLHSENVQTGLPRSDPDAAREPATTEIIDIDYEIMDVESQLLDVAATLADRRGGAASSRDYLLCPEQLSSFTPAKRLCLFQAHLSRLQKRLAPDSALAPRHHETDKTLREASGCRHRQHRNRISARNYQGRKHRNPHLSPQLSGNPMLWHQFQCHQV